ncbi:MAG: hypothetical protein HOC74_06140 [Gemmatimonadetes bacterium]|jgi:hypothetical protein|nr:hypothetical protein [Gemmatimonadota bacterium]
MTDEPPRPQWAPRVRMALIKRLYEADAAGLADDDLVNEVGFALLMRCETIYRVTERRCPECGDSLEGAHDEGPRDRTVHCPGCGWTSTWRVYHRSYKGHRIHGGRAYPEFVHYFREFPKCRTRSSKMRAIDRLIHAVHQVGNAGATPAAQNLVYARPGAIKRMLDDLAYGDQTGTDRAGIREDYFRRMEMG